VRSLTELPAAATLVLTGPPSGRPATCSRLSLQWGSCSPRTWLCAVLHIVRRLEQSHTVLMSCICRSLLLEVTSLSIANNINLTLTDSFLYLTTETDPATETLRLNIIRTVASVQHNAHVYCNTQGRLPIAGSRVRSQVGSCGISAT
jgi:hypothetical protein